MYHEMIEIWQPIKTLNVDAVSLKGMMSNAAIEGQNPCRNKYNNATEVK